jgi:hypothetical protein
MVFERPGELAEMLLRPFALEEIGLRFPLPLPQPQRGLDRSAEYLLVNRALHDRDVAETVDQVRSPFSIRPRGDQHERKVGPGRLRAKGFF